MSNNSTYFPMENKGQMGMVKGLNPPKKLGITVGIMSENTRLIGNLLVFLKFRDPLVNSMLDFEIKHFAPPANM